MAVIKALEVDFVQVYPGPQILEHLRRSVSIRNKTGDQATAPGLFKDCDCPLAGDQGLVVGTDENLCSLPKGIGHEGLGVAPSGGEIALGSRSACEVTQFWQ